MITGKKILVTGAGGFIGGHIVKKLREQKNVVMATDIKPMKEWVYESKIDAYPELNLTDIKSCESLLKGNKVDYVFNFAADIGGMAYITTHKAGLMFNNGVLNVNMLEMSAKHGVGKFFYSSSACAYPWTLQEELDAPPLKESDVIPANPDSYYGWEKLYMEKLCEAYEQEYGLKTRVARFHSIYGPGCDYSEERGKAPAALLRKAMLAKNGDKIEVWGDGKQQRTFLYIDDCIDGILKITEGSKSTPYNLGTEKGVDIDYVAQLAIKISGKKLELWHNMDKPRGVNSRSADWTLANKDLGWKPKVYIEEGMEKLHEYLKEQGKAKLIASAKK